MTSTPEIFHAGEFLSAAWMIFAVVACFVAEAMESNQNERSGWPAFWFFSIFAPFPIWELSHLFGPVITWAFVFGFLHLAALFAILFKLSGVNTRFTVNMPPGQAGQAQYRGHR